MKFHAHRDVLSEAVSFTVKLLPQRTTMPILSGVLIEAADGAVTLSSFDFEVSARTTIAADVDAPGRTLVSGRLLAEIAQRLPQAPVTVAVTDNKVELTCGSSRFSLAAMPVDEYPTLPSVSEETGLIMGDDFAEAIAQVAVAASRDDVTPVITGVQLEVHEQSLSLIATDRYRVAVREIPWDSGSGGVTEGTALIPARTLAEVGKTLAAAQHVSVSITSKDDRELIAFTGGDKTVTSLLIKGNFPPVTRLFPETIEHFAVVNTADLTDAVRRVQLVLERDAALRFTFGDDQVSIEAIGGDQAQASERVEALLTGDDMVVSLKPQFLLDGLAAVHSPFARIAFTHTDNPNKPGPVLITGQRSVDVAGEEAYRYLLQPNLLLR